MDIEEHLALHRDEVRKLALELANYDDDDADDAEQVILELMWKRHESGAYDHERPIPHKLSEFVSLLGYLRPYIRGIVLEEIDKYKHFAKDEKGRRILNVYPNADYDNEDELNPSLEGLQEQAQLQGRDRVYLESLYESPIPGLKTPLEGTLSLKDQELAEKLMANLTPEEIAVLSALVGPGKDGAASVYRTEREAAESLGMAWTTYWRRLQRARAKVQTLVADLWVYLALEVSRLVLCSCALVLVLHTLPCPGNGNVFSSWFPRARAFNELGSNCACFYSDQRVRLFEGGCSG